MSREITIRSIQHFMYCPHRWGLMEIDCAWAENMFVTKANLMHERVHDPDRMYIAKGKKVYTSVPVYHDKEPYNLYGVTDCIELIPDTEGVSIEGVKGKYKLCIVEYKPSQAKGNLYREEDLMQVFAQKICVDYVFQCDCDAVLYYADTKKRVILPLKENFSDYDTKLQCLLLQMREYLQSGYVPPIQKGQNCSGCSMKDLCMPQKGKRYSFVESVRRIGLSEDALE